MNKPKWISEPRVFVNTELFSESANFYNKHGYYTNSVRGSLPYREYWKEEVRRCVEGYSVGGVWISGRHYFYLNFCRIKKTVEKKGRFLKQYGFPLFLDMDYYYFLEIEECLKDGLGLAILKARRKGFSYKNSNLCVYEYVFERESTSIIGAYMDEYCDATMTMAKASINFLNEYTAFGRRKILAQSDHVKSGFKEIINNIEVEKGWLSEIYTLTFNKNAYASIGKSANVFLWEESGVNPNLLKSYMYTLDTLKDGGMTVGLNLVFGTAGDMQSGASTGFEELFYNPEKYDLRSYDAKCYDESDSNIFAGLFIDDCWGTSSLKTKDDLASCDKNGNSNRQHAHNVNLEKRELQLKNSKNTKGYESFIINHPLYPKEGFLILDGGYFNNSEISGQITDLHTKKKGGTKGFFRKENGKLIFDKNNNLKEAEYPFNKDNKEGCVVIYEEPFSENGVIPYGLYIAGTDPYVTSDSEYGTSLGSTFVWKRFYNNSQTYNLIVCEYTGRPNEVETYYKQVQLILEYYNAKCLYENNYTDMKACFEKWNCLHLLAKQPTILKDILPNSRVNRGYGIHMNKEIKDTGLVWLRDLLNEFREDLSNYRFIGSLYLLKELLQYNRKQNFDRVSAMILIAIYIQENHKLIVSDIQQKKSGRLDSLFKRTFKHGAVS